VHGPGTQPVITVGSHEGGGGQASASTPSAGPAHAYPAHAEAPTTWQVNPFVQSLSAVQVLRSAPAVRARPSEPSANRVTRDPRKKR
jgi:hypothetical protein